MESKFLIMSRQQEIKEHFLLNNYRFTQQGSSTFLISEDEADWAETVLKEHNAAYVKDDEFPKQLNTERGILSVCGYYESPIDARKAGYDYAFYTSKYDATLYSKSLDERGLRHDFVVVG